MNSFSRTRNRSMNRNKKPFVRLYECSWCLRKHAMAKAKPDLKNNPIFKEFSLMINPPVIRLCYECKTEIENLIKKSFEIKITHSNVNEFCPRRNSGFHFRQDQTVHQNNGHNIHNEMKLQELQYTQTPENISNQNVSIVGHKNQKADENQQNHLNDHKMTKTTPVKTVVPNMDPFGPSQLPPITNNESNGLVRVLRSDMVHEIMSCPHCKQTYRDPRLLYCGHTYCFECLVKMSTDSSCISCLKCEAKYSMTSDRVDTFPKNLFVADMQEIPAVEIDRGENFRNTYRSLEQFRNSLLQFSDRIENSEERLVNWIQAKKIEVTQNALRVIEKVRNVESEFHDQLDDFKNNRIAALRSAPAELKDTNVKLLEFVNETLQEIERKTELKEDEVREIGKRNQEHRRLWTETESLFNSHYAVGPMPFSVDKMSVYERILSRVNDEISSQKRKGVIRSREIETKRKRF